MLAHKKSSSLWHLTELTTTSWIRALGSSSIMITKQLE